MNEAMDLGTHLKNLRAEKGLTQKELARISKVSEQQISRYENGTMQPNVSALKRLASALNVPMSDISGQKKNAKFANEPKKTALLKQVNSYLDNSIPDSDIDAIMSMIEAFSLKAKVHKIAEIK